MTKTIQMYSLAILLKYFLKDNKLSGFCVAKCEHLHKNDNFCSITL